MFFHAVLQTITIDNQVSEKSYEQEQDFADAYWSAMTDSNIKLVTVNPDMDD
jgi:hypothetical protein